MAEIFYGGSVVTMENEYDAPEAVLVEKGVIRKVGSLQELSALAPRAKMHDLQGGCLMPGFIDPHSHTALNGQMAMFANLSECRCFDDVVEAMRRYIAENKITPKNVAMGFGYDHNFLEEQSHPTKEVLDKVSKTIPVAIMHVSGHLGCGNSALLAIGGVDQNTPDPQGGRFGRVAGSSEPNGYFEEAAMMGLQGCLKKIKMNFGKMLGGLQQNYIEHGVTTLQEGAANKGNLSLLKLADLLGKLKADVVVYPQLPDGTELFKKNAAMDGRYKKHLKLGGYKMILDGSPQGRSAWMSQPYLGGEPDYCGYPWLKDEEALDFCRRALADNRQILTHCNGDAASQQFLDAYEKAYAESGNPNKANLRPVMIHCQTVRNDQLDRMAGLKMIASIFVGHVYYWGDIHMKNFGPRRGHHISPAKDALDRGLVVNFHQDTPVTKPDMMHSVWAAVNRQSRLGNLIGEEQKIGVYDALKAVTINAAYQYFEEDSKGSIKEGKRADLVVLDRNPLEADSMEIKDIRVLETIKDGKTIYKA